MNCLFCKIIKNKIPCHKIWEDENHLAFLSIFPNTEGFSVVIPKKHYSSDAFNQSDKVLTDLIVATKKVANLLKKKLENVGRVGLIIEGFGVDHLHTKLFPMHGTADLKKTQPIESKIDKYFEVYEGYISSHDYKQADNKKLKKLAKKIRN